MNRRKFLAGALAFGAAGSVRARGTADAPAPVPSRPPAFPKRPIALALQWGPIPGAEVRAKLDWLEAHDYAGVELPADERWLRDHAEALQAEFKARKLRVGPACGPSDLSMADPAARDAEVARLCRLLDLIGPLGSAGLIVCPARGKPELGLKELRADFVSNTGRRLATHAAQRGTRILLEPLRRGETPFLRQVPDGARMAKEIGTGAAVMADIWHMAGEEADLFGAMLCARGLLAHVHIASLRNRCVPGTDGAADDYGDAFRGLQALDYDGLVSFEGCFPKDAAGKRIAPGTPAAAACLERMCAYLREQWAKAALRPLPRACRG